MAKNFKNINNPALQFISEADPVEAEVEREQPTKAPKGKKQAELFKKRETKSKQLNVRVYPSVYNQLETIAKRSGNSVGDIVNEILKDFLETDTAKNYLTKE